MPAGAEKIDLFCMQAAFNLVRTHKVCLKAGIWGRHEPVVKPLCTAVRWHAWSESHGVLSEQRCSVEEKGFIVRLELTDDLWEWMQQIHKKGCDDWFLGLWQDEGRDAEMIKELYNKNNWRLRRTWDEEGLNYFWDEEGFNRVGVKRRYWFKGLWDAEEFQIRRDMDLKVELNLAWRCVQRFLMWRLVSRRTWRGLWTGM